MKKLFCAFMIGCIFLSQMVTSNASGSLEDDAVVYTIDESSMNKEGKIVLDGEKISNALLQKAWSDKPNSYWMPGDTSVGKMRIVNKLPCDLRIADYTIKVQDYGTLKELGCPDTLRTSLPMEGTFNLDLRGNDGNLIPASINCFRCPNAAIAKLYNKSTTQLTLEDLMHLEDKIHEAYPSLHSYKDYICYYYGVDDLSELDQKQKSAILDGSRFYVTKVGNEEVLKEHDTLKYACSENGGSLYIVHEKDEDIVKMGYNYYFDTLMTFSFDRSLQDIKKDQYPTDYAVMSYLDPSSVARIQLDQFLLDRSLKKGESMTFDSLQYHINGRLMGNAYANREVPAFLNITLTLEPVNISGYAFYDSNQDGIYEKEESVFKDVEVKLWEGENLIDVTKTNENGFYMFDSQDPSKDYHIEVLPITGYQLTNYMKDDINGNRFLQKDTSYMSEPFKCINGLNQYNVGLISQKYTLLYDANGGKGYQIDNNNPYKEKDQVTILDQGSVQKDHAIFKGWNTQKDGLGETYQKDQIFTMPSHNVILYAMWEEVETPINPTETKKDTPIVTTGDTHDLLPVILLLLAASAGIIVVLSLRKKED